MDQDVALNEDRPKPVPFRPTGEPAPSSELVIIDPSEHNIVFTSLVTSDQDVVGLVAYSIYKQNKYDWLMAFSRTKNRMPNDTEAESYLLGESTPRRLATYRHLAEATLEGRGIDVPGGGQGIGGVSGGARSDRGGPAGVTGAALNKRALLLGAIVVILIVIAAIWYMHGGLAAAPK